MKANTGKGFKALEATLEDLKIHWSRPEISETGPRHVPMAKLQVCPKAFQVRHVSDKTRTGASDQNHVTALAENLDREGDLDPILVLPISYNRYVIIDGFHRAAAYKRRGKQTIPAVVFAGTPSEAKLIAGRENAKAKKEWTAQEKSDHLWRLIKDRPLDDNGRRWTLKMCATAAFRSTRLAEHMSAYLSRCKDHGLEIPERWHGGSWTEGAFEDAEGVSKRVQEKAEQIWAAIGDVKTLGSAHLVAKALLHAYERAGDIAAEIMRAVGDYGDLAPDLAEVREEAVSEAVGDLRDQVAAVEQHMQDVRTRATIASFLFDASRYAGSPEEYQDASAILLP